MQANLEVSLNCQRTFSSLKILLLHICSTYVGQLYLRVNAGLWNVDQQPFTF